eukprot:gene9339-19382_t
MIVIGMKLAFCSFIALFFKAKVINNIRHYTKLHVQVSTIDAFKESQHLSIHTIKAFSNSSLVDHRHPVVEQIVKRYHKRGKPGRHRDNCKIGLAIEGGGMRGCVAAGATAALNFLGLDDCFDIVYGSSAGAMVGAYFITRQVSGVAIYHDLIPAAGSKFINKRKLLHAIGLSVKFPILFPLRASIWSPENSVLNLEFLLNMVMGSIQPLDWNTFQKNNLNQPLRVIATSLRTLEPVVLSSESNNFHSLPSLLDCIRASMLVPGICGRLMGISESVRTPFLLDDTTPTTSVATTTVTETDADNTSGSALLTGLGLVEAPEPLVDALLSEPLPFRSAIKEGCTHVVVLRTRPDPCPMLGTGPGLYENHIARRFFNFHKEHPARDYLIAQRHQILYATDILLLNDASGGPVNGVRVDGKDVHLLPVAPSLDCKEVHQLESKKHPLLTGMRDGARRVFEIFGPPLGVEGDDIELAVRTIFPDTILDRNVPLEVYKQGVTLEYGSSNM